ncbi:hypothetical protein L0B52_03455 [Suttonella sp. R2A3]|uniref:multiheme c-type cytochrome n=1 Tax=Suttonella sp. R2A3 TaxID=2908648 RepID=UPI001F3C7C91|nr:hypothetical protein [Suttonella sp. R2A3]UJF25219.1 hypothetical protein L0B52_03455 [Suttonella sp. R2A3]
MKTRINQFICLSALMVIELFFSPAIAAEDFPAPSEGCLTCHQGIEPIRDHDSLMMQQIYAMSNGMGDPNGCVVCHGGTPEETEDADLAHSGTPKGSPLENFTPVPASFAVMDKTCGMCHYQQTQSIRKSIMSNESGKIKVITYGWGVNNDDYLHRYGNQDMQDSDGPTPIYGSPEYKAYVTEIVAQHADRIPSELKKIPQADMSSLEEFPEQAAYSFLRNCNACHLPGKGKPKKGHYRGLGCAGCHIPYGLEGQYEGNDPSIDPEAKGKMLVHSMQGTEKSKVQVHDTEYSGIQIATCNACHSSGRRVSLSFQGLFAADRTTTYAPFDAEGNMQGPSSTYLYKHLRADVHFDAGMICQDCHTSPDLHGNGNIGTVALANVEPECQDCHGTPTDYPWDLPLGVGDELIDRAKLSEDSAVLSLLDEPRGLAENSMTITQTYATTYDKKDGYLISSRGNAFGNVVKDGDKVILHSATGKTLEVPILKDIEDNNLWQNPEGRLAMVGAPKHLETMECYACHATWAPSYLGYTYKLDYSEGNEMVDWVESSAKINPDGTTSDTDGESMVMQKGAPSGDYSHARWEEPVLGINGEGRVTPLVGVIQTTGTVVDEEGKVVLLNNVAKREEDGMLTIDMQPLNPHTTTRQARGCSDCHLNEKTMGYGMSGGDVSADPQSQFYLGLKDDDGQPIAKQNTAPQIESIKNLNNGDYMTILDQDGNQQMAVGPHFERSGPLSEAQRDSLKDPDYLDKAKAALEAQ